MRIEDKIGMMNSLEKRFGERISHPPLVETKDAVATFRGATEAQLGDFWEATSLLGKLASERMITVLNGNMTRDVIPDDFLVVGIPRGTYPFLSGVMGVIDRSPVVITNDGEIKDESRPLVPEEITGFQTETIVIVDPVIDKGNTIRRTMSAFNDLGVVADRVVSLAVVSHPPTIVELLDDFSELFIITVETENELVQSPEGDEMWLKGFGDIGGLAKASIEANESLSELWLDPGFYLQQ